MPIVFASTSRAFKKSFPVNKISRDIAEIISLNDKAIHVK